MTTQTAEPSTAESNVQIDDLGPCRKKLTIEVPAAKIAATLRESLQEISSGATLPGFRPGKAPTQLIERRYGAAIRNEAKQKLASEAYSSAVEDHGLRVLGDPEGGKELLDAELDPNSSLSFTLEIEVAPEFESPSLANIELLRPEMAVEDAMIEDQLEKMATNEGRLEAKEEAEHGDYLVGHGVMKRVSDDKVVHDIEGAVIQIPTEGDKGMILGVMVDDFRKQVGTPAKGADLTVKTVGPDQHEVEEVRGENLVIEFRVEEINTVIPAQIEELVQRLGAPDEEELRKAIRMRMEQQVELDQRSLLRRQMARKVLDAVDFDLPERLSAAQAARNLERQRMEMIYQGVDANEIEERLAEIRAASDEAAQRELKMFFVLDRVATESDVKVTEQEINGYIVQMAQSRNMRPEAVRNELMQGNRIQNVALQIREHKAIDALIEKASVKDVSIDEFNAAMEAAESGERVESTSKKKAATKKTSKKKTSKKKSSTKKSD